MIQETLRKPTFFEKSSFEISADVSPIKPEEAQLVSKLNQKKQDAKVRLPKEFTPQAQENALKSFLALFGAGDLQKAMRKNPDFLKENPGVQELFVDALNSIKSQGD